MLRYDLEIAACLGKLSPFDRRGGSNDFKTFFQILPIAAVNRLHRRIGPCDMIFRLIYEFSTTFLRFKLIVLLYIIR